MRKGDNISIPGFKAPKGWHIKKNNFMKNIVKDEYVSFRLSKELIGKIEEFAELLELRYLPIKGGGFRSVAIRLLIEDTLLRFFGPKDNPDQIESPHYSEMSKILPVLKNIRLMRKLDEMPEDISHNTKEINKIIKKYA